MHANTPGTPGTTQTHIRTYAHALSGNKKEKNPTPPVESLPPATVALLRSPLPDILDLATALIDIDSVSGCEGLMGDAMAIWFRVHGYTVELQPVQTQCYIVPL